MTDSNIQLNTLFTNWADWVRHSAATCCPLEDRHPEHCMFLCLPSTSTNAMHHLIFKHSVVRPVILELSHLQMGCNPGIPITRPVGVFAKYDWLNIMCTYLTFVLWDDAHLGSSLGTSMGSPNWGKELMADKTKLQRLRLQSKIKSDHGGTPQMYECHGEPSQKSKSIPQLCNKCISKYCTKCTAEYIAQLFAKFKANANPVNLPALHQVQNQIHHLALHISELCTKCKVNHPSKEIHRRQCMQCNSCYMLIHARSSMHACPCLLIQAY
eukprot:jgi/Psemu1/6292/gm1.6292_g